MGGHPSRSWAYQSLYPGTTLNLQVQDHARAPFARPSQGLIQFHSPPPHTQTKGPVKHTHQGVDSERLETPGHKGSVREGDVEALRTINGAVGLGLELVRCNLLLP